MPPSLTETLDSLWSSTWPHFRKEVIDAIFLKKNPMFFWLSQKGRVQYVDGGRDIRYPIEVDVNPTVEEIGENGEVSLADVDPFTTVIYPWATLAGNITRRREDDAKNRGKAAIFSLMEGKKNNLTKSMHKKMNQLTFRTKGSRPSDGFYSLLDLIDTSPTDSTTLGGINQSTYSWWRNQQRTATGVAGVYARKDMQQLFYDLEDVEKEPDLIVGHRDYYAAYEDDLLEMSVFGNKKLADAGFSSTVYRGVAFIKDTEAPSTELRMINSDYLYLVLDRQFNFEMTPWKEIVNKPFDRVAQIVLRGQLLSTNRAAQGVLSDITY